MWQSSSYRKGSLTALILFLSCATVLYVPSALAWNGNSGTRGSIRHSEQTSGQSTASQRRIPSEESSSFSSFGRDSIRHSDPERVERRRTTARPRVEGEDTVVTFQGSKYHSRGCWDPYRNRRVHCGEVRENPFTKQRNRHQECWDFSGPMPDHCRGINTSPR